MVYDRLAALIYNIYYINSHKGEVMKRQPFLHSYNQKCVAKTLISTFVWMFWILSKTFASKFQNSWILLKKKKQPTKLLHSVQLLEYWQFQNLIKTWILVSTNPTSDGFNVKTLLTIRERHDLV